jgi:hypothetical protein
MPMSQFSDETTPLGSTRGYTAVISGHRESPPVQRIRRNEAPEMTGGDSSRQLPITRNEGVPGSNPGVGSPDLQGKSAWLPAVAGVRLEHTPANVCSRSLDQKCLFAGSFPARRPERLLAVHKGLLRRAPRGHAGRERLEPRRFRRDPGQRVSDTRMDAERSPAYAHARPEEFFDSRGGDR